MTNVLHNIIWFRNIMWQINASIYCAVFLFMNYRSLYCVSAVPSANGGQTAMKTPRASTSAGERNYDWPVVDVFLL